MNILLGIIAVSMLVIPGVHAQSIDMNEVIKIAEIGDALVESGQGTMLFTYVRKDSLSSYARQKDDDFIASLVGTQQGIIKNNEKIDLQYSFEGPKIWCQEIRQYKLPSGRWFDMDWQWAYNGEKLDLLRMDAIGDNDLIIPMGSVREHNDFPMDRFDPVMNGLFIQGTPVAEFLNGIYADSSVEDLEFTGYESIDALDCITLHGTLPGTDQEIQVWLVPRYNYRPLRVDVWDDMNRLEVKVDFYEIQPGIWFPSNIRKRMYYTDQTGKEKSYKMEYLVIKDEFEINIDIPDGTFEVEFPVGMSVYDFRTGESNMIE
jgi:hypothetical protein